MRKKKTEDKPAVIYTPVEVMPSVEPDVLVSLQVTIVKDKPNQIPLPR